MASTSPTTKISKIMYMRLPAPARSLPALVFTLPSDPPHICGGPDQLAMLGHDASGSDGRPPEKRFGRARSRERGRARDSGKASRASPKRGQSDPEVRTNAEFAAFLLRISRLVQPSLPSRSNDVFREGD